MWNLKNKMNEYNRTNRFTNIENKLVVISGGKEAKRGKIGVGD